MKRPGFSISTFLLVVVLLGAVAFVGSMVNPLKPAADHSHEGETAQTPAANTQPPASAAQATDAASETKRRQEMMKHEAKQRQEAMRQSGIPVNKKINGKPVVAAPLKDPEAIDTTSDFFFKAEMGAEGIKKQAAEIAIKKKEYQAASAEQKATPFAKMAPLPGSVPTEVKPKVEPGHEGHGH